MGTKGDYVCVIIAIAIWYCNINLIFSETIHPIWLKFCVQLSFGQGLAHTKIQPNLMNSLIELYQIDIAISMQYHAISQKLFIRFGWNFVCAIPCQKLSCTQNFNQIGWIVSKNIKLILQYQIAIAISLWRRRNRP